MKNRIMKTVGKNIVGAGVLGVFGLAMGLAVPASAQGTLINVDVNYTATMSGAAAIGNAGDIWNETGYDRFGNTVSLANLVDSTGAATSVSVAIANVWGYYSDATGTTAATAGLMQDYLNNGGQNQTMTISLTGLAPNGHYDLLAYAAGNAGNQNATMTGAINGTTSGTIQRSTFQLGNNYLENPDAIADATGALSFTVANGGGGSSYYAFNGLQIQAVPEPSTMAILAGSGLMMLLNFRRRK